MEERKDFEEDVLSCRLASEIRVLIELDARVLDVCKWMIPAVPPRHPGIHSKRDAAKARPSQSREGLQDRFETRVLVGGLEKKRLWI